MTLQLRPNCECCDVDLPPESAIARICSFECTFCTACVATRLPGGLCPNCGGGFVPRPIRPPAKLSAYPASTARVLKPHGACADRDMDDSRRTEAPSATPRNGAGGSRPSR